MAMDAFPVTSIPEERIVVFVCSTTGQVSAGQHVQLQVQQPYLISPNTLTILQGEVPSNMKSLWKFLLRKSLPADSLSEAAVAVFGLGDSGAASATSP